MRGRPLLFPALLLLLVLPPAQAGLPVGGTAQTIDPCVDLSPMFEEPPNPLDVVSLDTHCTAKVTFHHTSQNGTFLSIETEQVEIVVHSVRENGSLAYAIVVSNVESGKEFAIRCSTDRDRLLPTYPVRQWDQGCWGWLMDPAWMH